MKLDRDLLFQTEQQTSGDLNATLEGNGLYNTFQFVLRLSPEVHRKLAELPLGIVTSREAGFDRAKAFSTLLHETIHWWQHVGSTYGLMLSLSYPTQAHGNYVRLKELVSKVGFQKPIRKVAATLHGPHGHGTPSGLANVIVNNHFDFGAFRRLTYDQASAKQTVSDPLFESVGHAHHMTYANNLIVLASTVDPEFRVFQHPKEWEAPFKSLQEAKEEGFYYGSPINLWPLGAREILEGQACFGQLQYLAFASGRKLGWDDFKSLGMLHGVYVIAFEQFLKNAGLEWPPVLDHPTVGLFLLVCDMAINPGAGFPNPIAPHFASFITDTDPGARFTMLSTIIRLKCSDVVDAIHDYSRSEYEQVTERLAAALVIDSPLAIAKTCSRWVDEGGPFTALMEEHRTFDYGAVNLPIRVLFSHFLAFMCDKFVRPEFFCWPGSWMAGERVSEQAATLFDRHGALFIDKEDDDGIFPRLYPDKDEQLVQKMFDSFYAVNVTYDLTDQWISQPGPFRYDYRWLSQSGPAQVVKDFADRHFEQVYGVRPDTVELL